jgi:hypothetical protein
MLRRVIGKSGKITELTLAEVMRRVARNEFTVALFGDAGRMLGVEK